MPYQKSTTNNEVTFTVQPEKFISPVSPAMKIQIGCFSILLAAAPGGFLLSTGHPILAVIAFALVILFMRRLTTAKNPSNRIERTFIVTPESIKIDGKTFTKENVQRIIIRNGLEEINPEAAKVNYRVDIESNGTPLTIAIGQTEPSAKAILIDVCNILGMKIY